MTTEDGEIHGLVLDHEKPAEVRAFYGQFAGQRVVMGFESSGYAAWFEELLEELGCEIWLGHAAEIRRFAWRRQKNDRRDAALILDLLVAGDFPRLHRYSAASRAVLQQLRYRQKLVKMRTMVVNGLLFMASSRGVTLRRQLQSQRGQARMRQIALPPPLAQQRDELCQLLLELNCKIVKVQAWLEAKAEQDVRVQRLRTQHGIGPLTGLCLAHTLECPERFANPRHVTGYVGFDPVEDSSAERRRLGAISKQGSRLLRFYLVEAGQVAIRKDLELARVYKRLLLRRGHATAKVAIRPPPLSTCFHHAAR
ncbi:MAG: IS110 family transposase [Pyrinomonadaceae bacterium]